MVTADTNVSITVIKTEKGWVECTIEGINVFGVTTFRLNMTVVILTAPSYIVPEISLVKEIMYIAEDTELLFSGYLDIFNATDIERAVKGLDDAMTKIDPNNFMGINATGTVASFKRMLQEIKANISRSGIHMNVKYEPNADQVVRILRKANSDKEWSLVRSAEVVFTLQDMGSMRFVPATDYVGNITITFDPYSGLQEAHGKGLILTVVVTPTNDAPLLKDEVRTSLLQYRYNTIQYPYSGVGHFKAGSIASQLYRDMEGDMISIAVIGAIQTNLGQWVVGQDGDLAEILLFDMRKLKEAGQITQKAVLVNPTSEVRFLLRNSSYMWQRYENPRLFIAAIDAGVIPKLDAFRVVEINISICREGTTWEQQLCIVDSSSSYSRTVLDLYMGRQGCDGIAGSTLMEDKCGVCGGKNDCFDCNGDPNGTAYYDPCDLSKCVGGNTGIKSNENLDCAGVKCGKHYIHDKFGCIPVSTDVVALNLTLPCDGQLLSDAFINECEICVVGATGLAADAGMDACGVCHGDNSTCMDCAQDVKGDKVVDFCGKCRSPSDPQFNKGCGASLGTVYPKFIFAKYEGNLSVAGANLEAFSDARCYVHSAAQTRQFLETLDFNASSGIIKLSLPNITSSFNGEYFVSCDLNSNKSLNVTDGKIYLYGNPTLLSLEPKDITVGNITSVTIKGKNITDTGKVYCVLKCQEIRPEYGCQSIDNKVSGFVNFSAKLINSATVLCDLSRLSKVKSARVYNLSVVTGELSDVDLNSLSYVNLRVTSAAPKPLQAQYDDTMCNIQVTFDEGIAIREDIINPTCADIFDEDTKKFLEGAECRVHGQMLSISPRSASTTYIGKLLTFKSGVIKRFSTSEDVAEYATGTLTILQPSSPIVPELILRSPSLISTCDAVSIKAHVQKRGCLTYTFSWKVTGTRKDPTAMDTGDKVSALMRKIAQLANDVILVNGSELSAGFDFNFAVNLTTQFGDIVTAEKILSLDDTVLIVPDLKVLGGVQEVNPTEKIIITSSIKKSACIADTQGNALYAWSIDAAIDSDINSMKPRTVIPGNTLRGGKTYTVTFTVTFTTITGETITGAASVSFKTTSSPLQPIINNGENFQHLIGNDLILNASLSYDPDKQTGVPTTYVWGCQEKFGDGNFYPCWTFDPSTKTPKIFTMAEGIITTFPKMMMREGSEFKFILTMQKDARNASTISTVKIVASDAPQIVHIRHTELINTNDYLVINTIVRAMRNGTIFAMVSNGDKDYEERALRKASTDLVKKTDKLMVWDRFDLVIPGNVFIPGATYNFMAIGIGGNSKDIEVREEFKSRVNSKPKVGTAMITPTSGVSMQTVFTVAIDDEWIDYEDEKNLQYYLYYWDGKERKQIGIHSTAGEKSLNLRLPAGQFEIMVEGCDSMQSCSEYRIPTTINVTTWNDHNRTDLLLQMARDAVETGDENGVNILLEVKSILEKQNLNSTLKLFCSTLTSSWNNYFRHLLIFYDKAGVKESLKAINKLLSGMGSRLSKQARNKCLKAVNDIIKSYSAGSSKGRRKRALSQDNPVSGMSVSMAETILNTFSNVFLDQSEDEVSSPDSLTFQSTLDAIMVGLCVTLKSYSVSPLVVKTNLAVVRAEKKNMSGMAGTEFEIGCSDCPDILNAPAKIQYGEEIARTYTNWNCSQDYLCLGLCLASAQITVDFISASGSPVLLFQDIHKRRSDLVNIKIFNPETNSAINLPELVIPVIISFKMNNTVDMTKNTLKCKVWNGEHWSEGKCDIRVPMKALITDGDIVNCLCTVLGIISLFEQNRTEVYTMEPPITTSVASPASSSHPSSGHATNGESTTTTGASTSPRSADLSNPNATRKVTFTLEHDYASIVGENKQEFHSSMISQLAKILGIFPSRIINFSSKPGSIIVIFEILPPSNGSEKTTIDAVNILGFLITSNAINLTTSNGTILKVQVSSFRIIDETTEPDSDIVPVFLPYIIGGVIGGAVVIGLAVLILVVLMKMKQKQKTYPNVTMPTGFSNAEQVKQAGMVSVLPISAKPSANKWIENELYPAVNEMDSLKQNKMNFDLADGGQYARQGPTLAIVDEDKGIQYRSIELDGNNTISTDPTNAATTARIGSASSSKSTSSRKDIPQVVI
ncbi:hypothetical protein ACJMK2_009907 [Sinanodonta woodiana]|uniref:PKD/REJ-like domain-containing protein n=1 Tax=Sinanodonta woodiana TaxID=1069815 RepID=A0ABD3VGP8_SINWO